MEEALNELDKFIGDVVDKLVEKGETAKIECLEAQSRLNEIKNLLIKKKSK